jgi:hypothetical protein
MGQQIFFELSNAIFNEKIVSAARETSTDATTGGGGGD